MTISKQQRIEAIANVVELEVSRGRIPELVQQIISADPLTAYVEDRAKYIERLENTLVSMAEKAMRYSDERDTALAENEMLKALLKGYCYCNGDGVDCTPCLGLNHKPRSGEDRRQHNYGVSQRRPYLGSFTGPIERTGKADRRGK